MKKILAILFTIVILTNCADKDKAHDNSPDNNPVTTIDSASYFLADTSIYNFMSLIIDSIMGDSNLLQLTPTAVDINNCGFSFTEIEELQILDKQGKAIRFDFGGRNFIASKADSVDITNQLSLNKGKHWLASKLKQFPLDTNYLNKYRTKGGVLDWEKFRQDGNGCIVDISIPIFNKERTKAMIKTGVGCHATLGSGYTYWFEKKKRGWVIVGKMMNWIS
jgi:hypothetical protein